MIFIPFRICTGTAVEFAFLYRGWKLLARAEDLSVYAYRAAVEPESGQAGAPVAVRALGVAPPSVGQGCGRRAIHLPVSVEQPGRFHKLSSAYLPYAKVAVYGSAEFAAPPVPGNGSSRNPRRISRLV